MKKLANGAWKLEKSRGSNGYLVPLEDGYALIDPGMASGAKAVVAELRTAGVLQSVGHLLLTHYDVDHAGAALRLHAETGAQLWMGAEDARILRGERQPGTPFRNLMIRASRPRLPAAVHTLGSPGSEGLTEPVPGIWAVPTPGHTPGHYAFSWGSTVFCGDAVLVRSGGVLRQFPGFLITDKEAALASTAVLTSLAPRWFAPGHGSFVEAETA